MKRLKEYDNDYWTVIFYSMTCSELLVNVSSLIIGDHSVILRHFQRVETAPCRACLNPLHTRVKCKAAEGRIEELRASRQRNYAVVTPAHTLPSFESCTTVADLDQALAAMMGGPVDSSTND